MSIGLGLIYLAIVALTVLEIWLVIKNQVLRLK